LIISLAPMKAGTDHLSSGWVFAAEAIVAWLEPRSMQNVSAVAKKGRRYRPAAGCCRLSDGPNSHSPSESQGRGPKAHGQGSPDACIRPNPRAAADLRRLADGLRPPVPPPYLPRKRGGWTGGGGTNHMKKDSQCLTSIESELDWCRAGEASHLENRARRSPPSRRPPSSPARANPRYCHRPWPVQGAEDRHRLPPLTCNYSRRPMRPGECQAVHLSSVIGPDRASVRR